jgi:hypothetical protein
MSDLQFWYPMHLCPICGVPAETTGRVCGAHFNFVFDAKGRVISWQEWVPTQSGAVTKTFTRKP